MAMESPEELFKMNTANLCPQCSVLQFNDEILASYDLSERLKYNPGLDVTAAAPKHPLDYNDTDYEYGDSILDLPVCDRANRKFPLDYKVVDSLPGLPYLEQSALRGCEFCSLLRLEITRSGCNITGSVEITLGYRLRPDVSSPYGLVFLLAKVAQQPDTSCVRPASIKPNLVPSIHVAFAVESAGDAASWLRSPRLRKDDVLCRENIQFMKDELDICVRNCHHHRATGFSPSRLLDLGPQMSLDSIRLIDSSQIVPNDGSHVPKYAALSYCWGSPVSPVATDSVLHLRTTRQSLEYMERHIHEKTIPRTILDAIKVCKALSIRYLWVDSLCIIQDEKSDWERESLLMTLIYKNAFVTICTPSSKSSNEGFLVRHRKRITVPFRSRVVPSIYGHYNLIASGTCQNERSAWPELDIDGTSWSTRGWTLQEFQMSNRVLIFGESMIHFTCHYGSHSENGYQLHDGPRRMIQIFDPDISGWNPGIYYQQWERMLDDYGCRLFTDIEDKLPAISGMAKFIADETGDKYLAGLWKSQLPRSLVWYANCHQNVKYHIELPELLKMLHSPRPYIAPSWSPVRLDVKVGRGFESLWPRLRECTDESTVVDARVRAVGENPFGRVQGGRIRIRGRSTTVSSDLTRLTCYSKDDLWYTLDRGVITYYNLDCSPGRNSCSQGEFSRLLIMSYPHAATWSLHERGHSFKLDEIRDCLTNHLPLHAASHGSSPDLTFTGFGGQEEHYSDRPASDSGWSHSRGSSVAGSSKEVETQIQTKPKRNSDDRPDESGSAHTGTSPDSCDLSNDNAEAYGLLIHPLPGTNEYVRVGVWASLVADGGGTALFDGIDEREIDLV